MTYLLDENGRELTEGHHEITSLGGGRYRARTGAHTEVIHLRE